MTKHTGGRRKTGKLLIIGGAEQREGDDMSILQRTTALAGGKKGRLLVCAVATREPDEMLDVYAAAFSALGLGEIVSVPMRDRHEAESPEWLEALDGATGVFLTGGDQMRITSIMAGTRFWERLKERHETGLFIAGTSAGAAAMSSTMITGGAGTTVRRSDVHLAPGLGLLPDSVVDTHFDRSGRVHRLMAVIGQNPGVLGVGLDENTAIEVDEGVRFEVLGSGVVMVFDGHIEHSNASLVGEDDPLSLVGVNVHVLPAGYGFDLAHWLPAIPQDEQSLA